MADDELKSFKIGDSHRVGMSKPAQSPARGKGSQDVSKSLGFQRIEGMLEAEDPEEVGRALSDLHRLLEEKQAASSTNRDKHEARKAMVAIELAANLVDYLYQTKEAMRGENNDP